MGQQTWFLLLVVLDHNHLNGNHLVGLQVPWLGRAATLQLPGLADLDLKKRVERWAKKKKMKQKKGRNMVREEKRKGEEKEKKEKRKKERKKIKKNFVGGFGQSV